MSNKNPRVDAYIDKAAAFAQPILNHLRELVHRACPGIEETLKWGMPAFEYRGLLGGMAAFKNHATFSLWKHELVLGQKAAKHALGQFGRLTSLQDLPPDKILLGYIRIAAKLNEAGIKAPSGNRARPGARRDLVVPDFFVVARSMSRTGGAIWRSLLCLTCHSRPVFRARSVRGGTP